MDLQSHVHTQAYTLSDTLTLHNMPMLLSAISIRNSGKHRKFVTLLQAQVSASLLGTMFLIGFRGLQ